MKIASTHTQNFGKIYLFPWLQEKFYTDAEKYSGLERSEIQKDVEFLIREDEKYNKGIIKQNPSGSFCFQSTAKKAKVTYSWSDYANSFRSFVDVLYSSNLKRYKDFVTKYQNEPYSGVPKWK